MSATLNDRRKAIAEYWMNGPNTETPPAHWALLAPPFPEYVSGHSTFSAASAAVLRRTTGSDRFGLSTVVTAGSSRRLGGIHMRSGDVDGRHMGRLIGDQVWAKARTYFNGTAAP